MVSLCVHNFVQLLSIALYRAFKFTFRCSTWSDIQMRKTLTSNLGLLVGVVILISNLLLLMGV